MQSAFRETWIVPNRGRALGVVVLRCLLSFGDKLRVGSV